MSPPLSRTDTIRFLTLDEFGRLLAAARGSSRDRALFLLAYRHGLRASEVGLLRAEDLDLRTLRLTVHRLKGSHSGTHPLQPDEAKAIRVWLREREQPLVLAHLGGNCVYVTRRGDDAVSRLQRGGGEVAADPARRARNEPDLRSRHRPVSSLRSGGGHV